MARDSIAHIPHILIVDDDTSFLAAAVEIASLHGLRAETAPTLDAARTKLRDASFDLMLLDLGLPDGDGLSFLEEIEPAGHMRIAIITGNPSVESAVRAIRLPVVDYLVKPLDRGALSVLFAMATSTVAERKRTSSNAIATQTSVGASAHLHQEQPNPQIAFHVGMTLEEVEREMLFTTMAYFNNHKPKAAQALGISLKTVYNRLARFGHAQLAPANHALEPGVAA
jgi:DNA-binding NtrC family response regulator